MSDYGEYQCEVVNSEGEKQLAKAFLNVQCKNLAFPQKYTNFYCR